MVHTFHCLGRVFALDVESGSVFEIDDLTELLIAQRNSPENTSGEFSRYTQTEIEEANAELDSLISCGALYTSSPKVSPTAYDGIVKALCLNISHNCNLRCTYCFADGGSYSTARMNMSAETAANAIDFLIARSGKRRNLEVDFFGGEPLLNLDVVKKTVAYARSKEAEAGKNFRFTITTNAYALTAEDVEFFNREMHNVVLSIDGRKDVHNSVRKTATGEGSFDAALKNALMFREKRGDMQYYVRGTFTAANKDFCADALALNDYGFDQISLEPVVLPEDNPLALKEADLPYLCEQYELLAKEYVERRKTDKWFNFFHFMLDLTGGPCLNKRLRGCGAGGEYLAISPDGSIYPCHRFDGKADYVIGNVNSGEFSTKLPQYFMNSCLVTKKGCADCFCKYYCSGGCAANSIEFAGDIDGTYPLYCELMRKRVECALAIYAIEHEK